MWRDSASVLTARGCTHRLPTGPSTSGCSKDFTEPRDFARSDFASRGAPIIQPFDEPDSRYSPGPYEVVSKLGEGGMGEVYKARDTRLNRVVAVKILPGDFANDVTARER